MAVRKICSLMFIALSVGAVASAASLEEIKDRGYLNVVTEDDYTPFEFIRDGKPTGFNNEVLEELRKYAEFDVKQDIMPFRGLLASVVSGKYDVAITGAIVTEERLRVFDFAMPISKAEHVCIKRKADDRIQEISDLAGLKLGIQAGSALVARLPELEVMLTESSGKLGPKTEYTSYPEIYADLEDGRIDYTINTIVNGNRLVRMKGDAFELCGTVTGPGFIAYPVKKGNTELLGFINGFVQHLWDNGVMEELQEKWFGETFPDLPRTTITTYAEFQDLTK